jgi:hypothetical protein
MAVFGKSVNPFSLFFDPTIGGLLSRAGNGLQQASNMIQKKAVALSPRNRHDRI